MIKVLIADDHEIIRRGLKHILSEKPDIVVADEASNGQQAYEKIKNGSFDVALLDVFMPVKGGLTVLKQLRLANIDLPVLILSVSTEEQYAVQALKAGAAGFLNKECPPSELIEAIYKAFSGGKYVSASLAENFAASLDPESDYKTHEILTKREFEIFCLIASGKTVTEIADIMYLSIKTISTFRRRILDKTGLKNNSEITYYAIKNGLVQ